LQYFYAKPINLTNFTINSGDYLIIEVIPNPIENQTSWDLYFKCLESFNCESCIQQYYTYPYGQEIILSSINPTYSLACNKLYITLQINGCSEQTLLSEDFFKYFHPEISFNSNPYLNTFNSVGGGPYSCGGNQSRSYSLVGG
jgi:hypothetical protein